MNNIFTGKNSKTDGFSLLEVLIVLVIIGILVLIALPDQTQVISKARATEAKIQLQHVYALQKAHFFERGSYSENLTDIGFVQEKLTTEGGNAFYVIAMELVENGRFVCTATSIVDFDQDGVYNTWSMDQDKTLTEVQQD